MTDKEKLQIAIEALEKVSRWNPVPPLEQVIAQKALNCIKEGSKQPDEQKGGGADVPETSGHNETGVRRDKVDWEYIEKYPENIGPKRLAKAVIALKQGQENAEKDRCELSRWVANVDAKATIDIADLKKELEHHRNYHRDEVGPDMAQSRVNTRCIADLKKSQDDFRERWDETTDTFINDIADLKREIEAVNQKAEFGVEAKVELEALDPGLDLEERIELQNLYKRVDELEKWLEGIKIRLREIEKDSEDWYAEKDNPDGAYGTDKLRRLWLATSKRVDELEKARAWMCYGGEDKTDWKKVWQGDYKGVPFDDERPEHGKKAGLDAVKNASNKYASPKPDEPSEGDLVWWESGICYALQHDHEDAAPYIDRLVKPSEVDQIRRLISKLYEILGHDDEAQPGWMIRKIAREALEQIGTHVTITREGE